MVESLDESLYRRDPFSFAGRVEMRPFESEALRDNRLGDPHVREVPVYVPPRANGANGTDAGAELPVVFILPAFTGRPRLSWRRTRGRAGWYGTTTAPSRPVKPPRRSS